MKKILTCLAVLLMAIAAMAFNNITFVFKDGTQKSYVDSYIDSIGMGYPSSPTKDSVYVYLKDKTKRAANINDIDSIRFKHFEDDSCLTMLAEECNLWFNYNDDSMTAKVYGQRDWGDETAIIPCKVEKDGKIYDVTSINNFLYMKTSYLTNIVISNSVTNIEDGAFSGCYRLTSIEIPKSVTSIGESAFSFCDSLKSINVSSDNKKFTSVDGVLYNKDITVLIACPSGLTSIEIPESVTSIGDSAFGGCRSLTSIEIPSSVTSIKEEAFSSCTSLTSIVIPESVTSIEAYAFYGCSSLTNIEIPKSVTSIGDAAFKNCSSLTSIEISESITSIGEYAFYQCSNLTSIEIPEGVTNIGKNAFRDCDSLTSINVSSENKDYTSVDGILYNKDITELIICPANSSLTSIEIPESVTSIGVDAFKGCSSLMKIEIPNTSSLTSIGYGAFYKCSSLTNIVIPESVTSIRDKAFSECSSLTSIEIPTSVTSISEYAFYNCVSLTSIEIPKSVTKISKYAFYGCKGLKTAKVPEGLDISDAKFPSTTEIIRY